MLKRLGLFFLLIFLLSGCRQIDDPRALASDSIIIQITESGCRPFELFVPSGELIQVKINNETEDHFTWYILFFDLEGEFDPHDKNNQIAKIPAPANTLAYGEFFSPGITAKYMTVCSLDTDPQQIDLINLLVVEPYPDQLIEEN